MQRGAQTQRTGPDHNNIGIHQAIVPQSVRGPGGRAQDMAYAAYHREPCGAPYV